MSPPRAVLLAFLLLLSVVSPVLARTPSPGARPAGQNMVARTFTLRVLSSPGPHATFWVAFGPLDGRFSMLRLHRADDPSTFRVTSLIPSHERTVFAYLEGQGVVHTRAGNGPADPVVTIARVGPVSIEQARLPIIARRPPVG